MDNTLWHPDHKTPMLKWWHGIYDHVFVALHPFYRIRSTETLSMGSAYDDVFDYHDRPDDIDDIIKSRGEAVRWADVHLGVAPHLPADQVYLAICLLSVLGFAERANVSLQKEILAYKEREKIYPPEESGLPAIMEDATGKFLAQFGQRSVTAWTEFREHSTVIDIDALRSGNPSLLIPDGRGWSRIWALHLPDPGILMTWGFEGTEALIAMTDRALAMARPETFFEGWYGTAATYCDVHNPPEYLLRRD